MKIYLSSPEKLVAEIVNYGKYQSVHSNAKIGIAMQITTVLIQQDKSLAFFR